IRLCIIFGNTNDYRNYSFVYEWTDDTNPIVNPKFLLGKSSLLYSLFFQINDTDFYRFVFVCFLFFSLFIIDFFILFLCYFCSFLFFTWYIFFAIFSFLSY